MKKNGCCFILMVIFACATENKSEQIISELQNNTSIKYNLIKDNLYSDENGDLYLKSINNEDLEKKNRYAVWLKTVYCDTCWTPTKNGWKDLTELKDFVDTSSFHLDTLTLAEGGDIYEDKYYKYFHKWMADGGTITLMKK